MKQAACVFIENPDGKVLAVSRKDDWDDFGLPGGKRDEGERIEEAAVRELYEETGIEIKEEQLEFLYERVCKGEDDYNSTTFRVNYREDMINLKSLSSEETGKIEWINWEKMFKGSFAEYNRSLCEYLGYRDLGE